jgi:hypothetical protein
MAKKLEKLSILPVNKTVVFYSPVEGDNTMVRTGTSGDGSCMFHSVLHAYSKEYVSSDRNGRSKIVRQLRASMAGNIDEYTWQDLGGGLIAKIPFQETFLRHLTAFYSFVNNERVSKSRDVQKLLDILDCENDDKLSLHKLMIELIDLKDLEQIILPSAYANSEDDNVTDCCTSILTESFNYIVKKCDKEEFTQMTKNAKQKVQKLIQDTLSKILNHSRKTTYKAYVSGLKNVGEDVDGYTIGLISDRFNRDIYFLDSNSRLPYRDASAENLKGRKSIIIMWVGGIHYEIVGCLLHGNRIQREFDPDDDLIQKLKTLLIDPQDIAYKYPELSAYVPREFRTCSSPSVVVSSSSEEDDSDNDIYAGSDSSYCSSDNNNSD